MIATEPVTLNVPVGMSKYVTTTNPKMALIQNALLLYPHILNETISHGRATEILGIRKSELIDIYDKLGYSYLDMTMNDLDTELENFRQLKKRRQLHDCCFRYNTFNIVTKNRSSFLLVISVISIFLLLCFYML